MFDFSQSKETKGKKTNLNVLLNPPSVFYNRKQKSLANSILQGFFIYKEG